MWSGADAQLLANVRFLAGYRRTALVGAPTGIEGLLETEACHTIASAEAVLKSAGVAEPRPAVLGLLWSGRLRADLERPLTGETELEVLS